MLFSITLIPLAMDMIPAAPKCGCSKNQGQIVFNSAVTQKEAVHGVGRQIQAEILGRGLHSQP
jgi:hypothetical protein